MQNIKPLSPCVFQEMSGNHRFDPFHLVKIAQKLVKSRDRDHKLSNAEGGQDTHAKFQAIPSMRFAANVRKPFRADGRTGMLQNGHGWSDGPTDQCTGGKRVYRASDGRADGQPENIMAPAPKGGGITTFWSVTMEAICEIEYDINEQSSSKCYVTIIIIHFR